MATTADIEMNKDVDNGMDNGMNKEMNKEFINDIESTENFETDDSEELYEHFTITVDKGQTPTRIDKFLTGRMENTSRHRVQMAADAGNIRVDDKVVKSSYKIKPEDRISILLPYPPSNKAIVGEDIPLDVVYEDDDLMIINKEAGLVVHPGFGNWNGTLVNALYFYMKDLPLFQTGDMRAGLVHRIDKNTSGLIVIAKTELAHVRLAKQFFDHSIERRYIALVWGNMPEDEGTIIGNVGRCVRDRMKMDVFEPGSAMGKHAVTHYKVLEKLGYVNLIECRLETGRTHQIRVHMEHIGHSLFNDERYGGERILRGTTFTKYKQFVNNCFQILPRHALHAKSLGFIHPITEEKMFFTSELPKDMADCVEKWRGYVSNRDLNSENE